MWQETDEGLYKRFEFQNFTEAFSFMKQVAVIAERAQHHPRWTNEWNVVEIWLLTHEANHSITDKDHELARLIDQQLAADETENESY